MRRRAVILQYAAPVCHASTEGGSEVGVTASWHRVRLAQGQRARQSKAGVAEVTAHCDALGKAEYSCSAASSGFATEIWARN